MYYPVELLVDRLKSLSDVYAKHLADLLIKFEDNMRLFFS